MSEARMKSSPGRGAVILESHAAWAIQRFPSPDSHRREEDYEGLLSVLFRVLNASRGLSFFYFLSLTIPNRSLLYIP